MTTYVQQQKNISRCQFISKETSKESINCVFCLSGLTISAFRLSQPNRMLFSVIIENCNYRCGWPHISLSFDLILVSYVRLRGHTMPTGMGQYTPLTEIKKKSKKKTNERYHFLRDMKNLILIRIKMC